MNRLLPGIVLASLSLIIAACGGGGANGAFEPLPPVEGLLKQVSSSSELEQSIKSGFSAMQNPQMAADAQFELAAAASGNFTGTYTQEARVEFDLKSFMGTADVVKRRQL